tara:strand:+ start:18371 stop:19276 length:906 start_codon:yes stop_codon:yes gene_type:complete
MRPGNRESSITKICIEPAAADEIAAALPYLGYMAREAMLPSMWLLREEHSSQPLAIAAVYHRPRSPLPGRTHDFIYLPMVNERDALLHGRLLEQTLEHMRDRLAIDHLVTPFTREDQPLYQHLGSLGFKPVSSAYDMAATNPAQIAAAFRAGREAIKEWAKGEAIELLSYQDGPEEAARDLHLQSLGLVPDGHYALFGMLENDKDYRGSCIAMKRGEVLGHVIISHELPNATCESIVIGNSHRGSPLVAHMCLEVISGVRVSDYERVLFSVNTENERSLSFTSAFDSVQTGMRHQMLKSLA